MGFCFLDLPCGQGTVNPVDSSWKVHITLPSQFETANLVHVTAPGHRERLPAVLSAWIVHFKQRSWRDLRTSSSQVMPFLCSLCFPVIETTLASVCPAAARHSFLGRAAAFWSPVMPLAVLALGGPQLYAGTFHSDREVSSFQSLPRHYTLGSKLLDIN